MYFVIPKLMGEVRLPTTISKTLSYITFLNTLKMIFSHCNIHHDTKSPITVTNRQCMLSNNTGEIHCTVLPNKQSYKCDSHTVQPPPSVVYHSKQEKRSKKFHMGRYYIPHCICILYITTPDMFSDADLLLILWHSSFQTHHLPIKVIWKCNIKISRTRIEAQY